MSWLWMQWNWARVDKTPMGPKKRYPKSTEKQPEVWVSPDLMQKLKGADGNRGVPVPQSPYLVLADHFLGLLPNESAMPSKTAQHRVAPSHPVHKTRDAAPAPEPPPRAMAAAAGAGAADGVLNAMPPRIVYPKPPARPASPPPPKLAASRPPARPHVPKLQPPKPPRLSFGYRRKVDRTK